MNLIELDSESESVQTGAYNIKVNTVIRITLNEIKELRRQFRSKNHADKVSDGECASVEERL